MNHGRMIELAIPQRGDRTLVQALDPQVMVTLTDNEELRPMADDAGARIDRALQALESAAG